MEFVDIQNTITSFTEKAFSDEQGALETGKPVRYLIIDDDNSLNSVYSRLKSRTFDLPESEVYCLRSDCSDKEKWKNAFGFDRTGNRINIAVISYADASLENIMKPLYSIMRQRLVQTGVSVSLQISLNIFRIFRYDAEISHSALVEKCRASGRALGSELHKYFSTTDAFPNCVIVNKMFFDHTDAVKGEMEKISFADEVFQLIRNYPYDGRADNVLSPIDFSLFREDDCPWVSYTMDESFLAEIIALKRISSGIRKSLCCTQLSERFGDTLEKTAQLTRNAFLKKISFKSLDDAGSLFNKYKGYVPVSSSQEEFENKYHSVSEQRPADGILGKVFGKKVTETVARPAFSPTALNTDVGEIKQSYKEYIKRTVPRKIFYGYLFNSFTLFNSSMTAAGYDLVKDFACKVVEKVFDTPDPFWKDICSYYLAGLEKTSAVRDNCAKMQREISVVLNSFDQQIEAFEKKISHDYVGGVPLDITVRDMQDRAKMYEQINSFLEKNSSEIISELRDDTERTGNINLKVGYMHIQMAAGADRRDIIEYNDPLSPWERRMGDGKKIRRIKFVKCRSVDDISLAGIGDDI